MQDRTYQFAAELAAHNPDAVAGIRRTHIPDDRGKCAGCHRDDKLRQDWPCVVRWAADRAYALTHQPERRAS